VLKEGATFKERPALKEGAAATDMVSTMVYVWVFIVTAAMALVALGAWYIAGRVKRSLEAAPIGNHRQTAEFTLPSGSALSLSGLSPEPLFLKRSVDGVRVQFEDRPFVPIHFLTDQATVAALRQVAATISERFGTEWSCLVTTSAEGKVSVHRL